MGPETLFWVTYGPWNTFETLMATETLFGVDDGSDTLVWVNYGTKTLMWVTYGRCNTCGGYLWPLKHPHGYLMAIVGCGCQDTPGFISFFWAVVSTVFTLRFDGIEWWVARHTEYRATDLKYTVKQTWRQCDIVQCYPMQCKTVLHCTVTLHCYTVHCYIVQCNTVQQPKDGVTQCSVTKCYTVQCDRV